MFASSSPSGSSARYTSLLPSSSSSSSAGPSTRASLSKSVSSRRRVLLGVALLLLPAYLLLHLFQAQRSSTPALRASQSVDTSGVGHFSEWSILQKTRFLDDLNKSSANAANWILVMGNEGGDLDSMTSALLWAYHLTHNTTSGHADQIQAVALLQTPEDALDLRPENKLALANARMSPGHSDLLTVDELPIPPKQLARLLHGIALVDHPRPRSIWSEARVVSLFDHHTDRSDAPDAFPRVIERTASCSSLVSNYMLDEREKMKEGYHVSHELLELALSAISLDSDGLTAPITTNLDFHAATRLFDLAPGYHNDTEHPQTLSKVAKTLSKTLKRAKKDLGNVSVRDLLRRDWKGDVVTTELERMPNIHLGFASIPYSLREMVDRRTKSHRVSEWFDIESSWTEEIRADVSVALTSFKIPAPPSSRHRKPKRAGKDGRDDKPEERVKRREIILVVRNDHRINETEADNLFQHIVRAVESAPSLEVRRWEEQGKEDKLKGRQMVWTHNRAEGGRKIVRPIVEDAVRTWTM